MGVVSTLPPVRLGRAVLFTVNPAPTADQRAGSTVLLSGQGGPTPPPGSSKRDTSVSVVCMCWHVKRWFVLCACALQIRHNGVGCVSGKIL